MSDVHRIYTGDRKYPELLGHVSKPPECLNVLGRLIKRDALAVAVVGARNPTPYGRQMARLIAARKTPLTKEGFFGKEAQVETLVEKMIALSQNPQNNALRQELNVNDDILLDDIRQAEVKNWLEHLVIPAANK